MDNTINHTGKLKSKAKVYEFHPLFTEKGKSLSLNNKQSGLGSITFSVLVNLNYNYL